MRRLRPGADKQRVRAPVLIGVVVAVRARMSGAVAACPQARVDAADPLHMVVLMNLPKLVFPLLGLVSLGATVACNDSNPVPTATDTSTATTVSDTSTATTVSDTSTATTVTETAGDATNADTQDPTHEDATVAPTAADTTDSSTTTSAPETTSETVAPGDTTANETSVEPECTVQEDCAAFECTCPDGDWSFQWCSDAGACLDANACELACSDHQVAGCSAHTECPQFQCTCPDGFVGAWQWCREGACQGNESCAQVCVDSGHKQPAPKIYPSWGADCLYGYECEWPGFQGECLMPEGAVVGYCTIRCATSAECPSGWSCGFSDGIKVCH